MMFKFSCSQILSLHIFCINCTHWFAFIVYQNLCLNSFFSRSYFISQIEKHMISIVLVSMLFLITVKIFTLCDTALSFIWVSWSVKLSVINIHRVMSNYDHIFWEHVCSCELHICSSRSYELIILKILINLLT